MAFLLTDAAKLTQSLLVRGIIQTLITESAVLRYLPLVDVMGSGVDFNQENALPSAQWHAPNDTWNTQSEPTLTKTSVALTILGGDADVDEFIQQVYSNKQDIQALVVQEKAKKVAYAFNDGFFNGDSSVTTNQFDGLAKQAAAAVALASIDATHRAFYAGVNGATLSLDMLDQLIDQVKPGKPDVLFMSRRTRRKLSSLRRASGNIIETTVDMFGRRVVMYDGIPVEIDDNIAENEVQGTSGAVCSSIYAVSFGAMSRISGIQNGGITTRIITPLETKDGVRVRIKWYVNGAVVWNPWAYCLLRGINNT